jgi:hypothetical protein
MKQVFEAGHVFLLGRTFAEYTAYFQVEDHHMRVASGKLLGQSATGA